MPRSLRHSALRTRLPVTLCFLALVATAHARERVTLRNGFSYDCVRRASLDDGRVRLFLDAGQSSYIDISAAAVDTVEPLPDPPPPASLATATPAAIPDVHLLLSRAGNQHNIDVELLASIVHAESGWRPHALSRTGAEGLMQLMPGTAHELGVSDAFQPADNIAGGAAYLDTLLARFHDNLALALAAYNAGPAAVDRFHGIPPFRETRAYVARVMTEFKRRKLAADLAAQKSAQLAAR